MFSLFNEEITLTVIAALLTLVGYSMNDTIVIFDRIRENLKLVAARIAGERDQTSVNQTLSRTVMTSGLTFLTVIALFLFGGRYCTVFLLRWFAVLSSGRILRFSSPARSCFSGTIIRISAGKTAPVAGAARRTASADAQRIVRKAVAQG